MKELSDNQLRDHAGGVTQIECFLAGAIFAAALGTGNLFAAAGTGLFLGANCFN